MKARNLIYVLFAYYLWQILKFWTEFDYELFNITFFDVGQGDSILISTPEGKNILVDGGPDFDIDYNINKKYLLNTCYIDTIFPTHLDTDHIGGLNRIIQRCKIGEVEVNMLECQSMTCRNFENFLSKQITRNVFSGYKTSFQNGGIIVYWPDEYYYSEGEVDTNDISTIMLVKYKNFDVLLTGDAGSEIFNNLDLNSIKNDINGELEIFKVSHHGALSSLNKKFVAELKPKYCVICVGEGNKYGHPHDVVIDFLEEINCEVLRTDKLGSIEFKVK